MADPRTSDSFLKPAQLHTLRWLTCRERHVLDDKLTVLWDTYTCCPSKRERVLDEIHSLGEKVRRFDRHVGSVNIAKSFETKRINDSTFVIREDDGFGEHPLIFAKVIAKAGIIVLSDTGTDEPSEKNKASLGASTRLRQYLEHCTLEANENKPLNPAGKLKYIIICTHCHYDHTLGIPQFLEGGTTEILASAAGRDFIESDLDSHGLFNYIGHPAPFYQVTKWAQAFERLHYPFYHDWDAVEQDGKVDLGITIIQTPGHTPDELAWYDHEELHLYVGDSLYREGKDGMPIIFPGEGSLVEWVFSMQKLAVFVRSENARLSALDLSSSDTEDDWVEVSKPKRVKLSCAHQTYSVDAVEILAELEAFSYKVFAGKVPIVKSNEYHGEVYELWREEGEKRTPMSIMAPRRLMEDARRFFGHPQ